MALALAGTPGPAWAQTSSVIPLVTPPPGAKPHKVTHPKPHAKAKPKPAEAAETKSATHPQAHPATHPPAKAPAAAAAATAAGAAAVSAAPAKPPPEKLDPTKGTSTGLKLPRWVSFRSDDVNVRTGPGMQYPIDWQYHRRDLPVSVLREYEVWRLVQMQDGTKGWVHQATLTGRRGFLIVDSERILRASPDDNADAVARLEAGVVGHVRSCEAGKAWCQVQTGDYRGWLKRTDMWGVDPDEAIN